jgi:hypothetical protein
MIDSELLVYVRWVVRTPVGDNPLDVDYHYRQISLPTPGVDGWRTPWPPAVGDLVSLPDAGMYRVVDRGWMFAGYGSMNWPAATGPGPARPVVGPILTVLVEAAEGMFVREVEDCRAAWPGSDEYDCELPPGHAGDHRNGTLVWTDGPVGAP